MSQIVGLYHYRHEAEFAKGFLDDAGIESVLLVDDAGGAGLGLAFANPARLLVPDEDAPRARRLLAEAGLGSGDPGQGAGEDF